MAEDTEAFGAAVAKGAGCRRCFWMKGHMKRLRGRMRLRRCVALRQLRQAEREVKTKLQELAEVTRQEEQRWRCLVSQRDRHLQVTASAERQ